MSFFSLFRGPVPADKDAVRAESILLKHPDLPSVMIEVGDAFENQRLVHRLRSESRLTQERLKLAIEMFDVRARAFARLVNSMETQQAVATVLRHCAQTAWFEFANYPFERADNKDPRVRQCWEQIADHVRHWELEGFRRLTSVPPPAEREESVRRGYRSHVRRWMKASKISTVSEAARKLGISESTLKSIMSERGTVRYGAETLNEVLKKNWIHRQR